MPSFPPRRPSPPEDPPRFRLLREGPRKAELAFLLLLFLLLAAFLLWSGADSLRLGRHGFLFVPVVLEGLAAAIAGCLHLVAGAGILFAAYAMGRFYLRTHPFHEQRRRRPGTRAPDRSGPVL